jgi:protein regulator of cytokinesis 1
MLDASELLTDIEDQIMRAREEVETRKEILDRVEKWLAACEEERWLEDYNMVQFMI